MRSRSLFSACLPLPPPAVALKSRGGGGGGTSSPFPPRLHETRAARGSELPAAPPRRGPSRSSAPPPRLRVPATTLRGRRSELPNPGLLPPGLPEPPPSSSRQAASSVSLAGFKGKSKEARA